ncbi:hypothetical protein [Nonomuraea sp. NPDC005650]|uniref:hypothetical protein n=1 Tax=Nonomuraea sp. NPDC005650 TaxID=3157045 RepID=UPI0033AAF5FB
MEKQLGRVQTQANQLGTDLVSEQSTATAMREQIGQLQAQIRALERTVVSLRAQLIAAGMAPVPASEATGPYTRRRLFGDG